MQRSPLAPVVLLAGSLLAGPEAAAQPFPSCVAEAAGLVACVAGKLCACDFDPGGTVTGRPAGHRWDCGALRPACGDAARLPATLDPYPYPLPPALSLDRSRTTVKGDRNRVQTAPGRGGRGGDHGHRR